MSIKVLLVDDHKILRDGLTAILNSEDDISIVAKAANGSESIVMAREHSPDVVVMDLSLPDMGGMEAIRLILAESPGINVLVLSMLLDHVCVFDSLEAGAKGYMAKYCAAEELVAAIRAVYAGKPYFCAEVQEILMQKFKHENSEGKVVKTLTKREREILKLIASGLNTKEIAFDLKISTKMVEVHRSNIKKKLGVVSVAQLTTYAVRVGLITV